LTDTEINILKTRIGIIGSGHLGLTIAEILLRHKFPPQNLSISYNGNENTLHRIRMAGLVENIKSNEELCNKSNIIFIAIRPEHISELEQIQFSEHSMVVSAIAGTPSTILKKITGVNVCRIMPSGPDTLKSGNGIVAVYPINNILKDVLLMAGLRIYALADEDMMHYFTVGVCLPAALASAAKYKLTTSGAIQIINEKYIDFEEIYQWAKIVLPVFQSDNAQQEYIHKMATKGGITEAIVNSIETGHSFLEALQDGVKRSREIGDKAEIKSTEQFKSKSS